MITKIGKEIISNKSEKKSLGQSLGVGAAAGILAPGGASAASWLVARPLARKVLGSASQDLSPAESTELIRNMLGPNSKVRVFDTPGISHLFIPSHFNPVTQTVVAPKESYVLAHELGHASGLLGKNKIVGRIGAYFSHGLGGPALAPLVRSIDSAQKAYNREIGLPESEDSSTLGALSTATRIGTAAQLAEEGQASVRGIRAIGRLQGKAGMLRAAKIFGPAFGTYVAAAAGSHAVAPWLGGIIGKRMAKSRLETEAGSAERDGKP